MSIVDKALYLVILVFALGVHECAHAWAALRFGDDTAKKMGRLTLNPIPHIDPIGLLPIIFGVLFGWAKPVPVNPHNVQNPSLGLPLIAAAGPLSNIAQMIVGCLVWFICDTVLSLPYSGEWKILFELLGFYIQVNIVLALFNLLPLYPLDGGKIISLFLPDDMADKYEATMSRFGFLPIFGLIMLNMAMGGALFSFWFGFWGPAFDWFFDLCRVPLNLSYF